MVKNFPLLQLSLFFLAAILSVGADAQHGEYIVKHVSMCIECHTPRNEKGELLKDQLFRGAVIPIAGPEWGKTWMTRSVNIDGFNFRTDEEAVHFLETGLRPDGKRANLPMPQFRMNKKDAEDVVAYLKNRGDA